MSLKLSTEQQRALDAVKDGRNVAILGPGGSGKSALITQIVAWARSEGKKVGVVSLTGSSAVLLGCGAGTLHSWAGIGLGNGVPGPKSPAFTRWKETDLLIVDEASMLTAQLMEHLERIATDARSKVGGFMADDGVPVVESSKRAWGGLQVLFSGDFLQLPPVSKGADGKFCFESAHWPRFIDDVFLFRSNFRQSDATFQHCLDAVRVGTCPPDVEAILRSRMVAPPADLAIKPTVLFNKRADVDDINRAELAKLTADVHVFRAGMRAEETSGKPVANLRTFFSAKDVEAALEKLDKNAQFDPELALKVGAQVMLLANLDAEAGLVNGARGVVTGFDAEKRLPIVEFVNGTTLTVEPHKWTALETPRARLLRTQLPLRLAWAITTHKSQGMTLDCAQVDLGSVFEAGQAYVALSRVRSLDNLFISSFNPAKIRANATVLAFLEKLEGKAA